jgi:hypothetical protein
MTHICLSIFKKNFGGLKEREKKADVTHVTFFQVLLDFLDLSLSSANLSAISAYKLADKLDTKLAMISEAFCAGTTLAD